MKKRCIVLGGVLFLTVHLCVCAEIKLGVCPMKSFGLPGELHKVKLRITMDRPRDFTLRIPHCSNLVLRAVERYPLERDSFGMYIQCRDAFFQGVTPGEIRITNIVAECDSTVYCFPALSLKILEVPAQPPPAAGAVDQ